MKKPVFNELQNQIKTALQQKLDQNPISGENGFTLIDGFLLAPLRQEIISDIIPGCHPSIPLVGVVGNTTGRIYTFALKILLPEINF